MFTCSRSLFFWPAYLFVFFTLIHNLRLEHAAAESHFIRLPFITSVLNKCIFLELPGWSKISSNPADGFLAKITQISVIVCGSQTLGLQGNKDGGDSQSWGTLFPFISFTSSCIKLPSAQGRVRLRAAAHEEDDPQVSLQMNLAPSGEEKK